jgi:hypothetical protein
VILAVVIKARFLKRWQKTAYFIRFYSEFRASFVIAVTGLAESTADAAGVPEALLAKLTLSRKRIQYSESIW